MGQEERVSYGLVNGKMSVVQKSLGGVVMPGGDRLGREWAEAECGKFHFKPGERHGGVERVSHPGHR